MTAMNDFRLVQKCRLAILVTPKFCAVQLGNYLVYGFLICLLVHFAT